MSNINPGPNVVSTPNTSFGVVTGTITQQSGPQIVGTGLTNPNMQATGGVNNYCQVSNQNTSNGVNASSDHIVYPDNIQNDGTGFMDMGICSSGYAQAQYSITGPNDGYMFMSSPVGNTTASGDMVFGTDTNGTSNGYRWYVNGFGKAIGAYAMKLTGSGALQLTSSLQFPVDNTSGIVNAGGSSILKSNAGVTYLGGGAAGIISIGSSSLAGSSPLLMNTAPAGTIASSSMMSFTAGITFVSGAAAIATISPNPNTIGGYSITIIPTGLFTTVTSGNIALASNAVVGRALVMTYDGGTAKWYPSY